MFLASRIALLIGLPTLAIAGTVEFFGVGLLPGGQDSSSQAFGVSADGRTVVGVSSARAFRWTRASGIVNLGAFPGGGNSTASDVSGDGSYVVGESARPASVHEAFRWSAGGGLTGLGHLPGPPPAYSHAVAITPDGGTVVGFSGTRAFRWTEASGIAELGVYPGSNLNAAIDVSSDGGAIAGYARLADGSNRLEAWRWTPSAGMVSIGRLPGSVEMRSTAISGDGNVVVGYSRSGLSGRVAFRWSEGGGLQQLVDLPNGGGFYSANAASADGSVLVGLSTVPGSNEAVIWRDGGAAMRLESYVTSLGLDLGGWQLEAAFGITPDGSAIVGQGRNPAGQLEGFVVYLPEPTSLALVAFLPFLRRGRNSAVAR